MSNQNGALEEYKINIDMWKHYDNLRQEKNKTFITVNTILVPTLGFLVKDGLPSSEVTLIASLVAFLGAIVCVLWLFLQSRNAKYIEYHILQTMEIEKSKLAGFTTFCRQQNTLKKGYKFENINKSIEHIFIPINTNSIDRILSSVMSIGWFGLAVSFLYLKQNC